MTEISESIRIIEKKNDHSFTFILSFHSFLFVLSLYLRTLVHLFAAIADTNVTTPVWYRTPKNSCKLCTRFLLLIAAN